ncbi:hypothetical protein ACIQRE_00195 [Streptomyces griseoluteus]|uniref:hypothetical protein n=1 Tax=Streptomyces griseoluteus TaxID=29306 RepID=UPI00381EF5FA
MAATRSGRWVLDQGDFTTRRLLHKSYGGSLMGGIVPLQSSTHTFLFSKDGQFGDGWRQDGTFYYEGATSYASKPWEDHYVNKAIETAWTTGRRLHLLLAPRAPAHGLWRYAGSFVFDGIAEERTITSPHGTPARYPLYRLRTIDNLTHHPGQMSAPGDPRTVDVRRVERCDLLRREALKDPLDGERPETRLSKTFERYLITQGYAVHRIRIRHSTECAPLFTDIWVAQLRLLIEAKAGKNLTDDVRYATGQLGQYTRHLPGVMRKAILLPCDPGGELRAFAQFMGADLVWPEGTSWCTTGNWANHVGIEQVGETKR